MLGGRGINQKSVYRVYLELRKLLKKSSRRRVKAKLRPNSVVAARPQAIWAMNFVPDQLAAGRKLRILAGMDTYSHYCPVIDPRFHYRSKDVVNTLERVRSGTEYLKVSLVDQGADCVSRDMDP